MRPTCVVHVVWCHFVPEPSTPFSQVSWSVLWLHHQLVTDVTAWLINPNPSCSKIRKEKEKIKYSEKWKIKVKSIVNNLDSIDLVDKHLLSLISQNELLTYLWYLNLGCTLRGLEVIQKFNNDNYQDRWRWTLFYFSFSFLFYFSFFFLFNFLFLEQLGLGFIEHAVTSVTNWWHSHKTNHGTQENGVEGSGIKWRHTTWTTHVGLMSYTWSFRVGCTVESMDHE